MKEEIQKYRHYNNVNFKTKRLFVSEYRTYWWADLCSSVLSIIVFFYFKFFVVIHKSKLRILYPQKNIKDKTRYRRIPVLHEEQKWMKWLFVAEKKLFSKLTAWDTRWIFSNLRYSCYFQDKSRWKKLSWTPAFFLASLFNMPILSYWIFPSVVTPKYSGIVNDISEDSCVFTICSNYE